MTQILLAEDDRLIGEMVRLNLEQDGYAVRWETDGLAAERALLDEPVDIAVLDVNLPGRTGFELARRVREAGRAFPILLLTARSDTASKVTGLDVGADDYLTKPFDVPELLARLRALLRRAGKAPGASEASALRLGTAQVDLTTGVVESPAGRHQLSPEERRLLALLWRRRGAELAFTEILDELSSDADAGAPTPPSGAGAPAPHGDGAVAPTRGGVRWIRQTLLGLRDRLEADPDRPVHFHLSAQTIRFEG